MKITDFFDKTFCINLERRSDRWEECVVEFNKYNLSNINRFIAVDGKQLPQVTSGFVTPSRLALVLTNIKILEESISNNYNTILILEDDVEFNDQVLNMNEYFKVLPKDTTFSTHCVAINNKAFNKIYDRLKKCDNALDVIYVDLQKSLNVYSFYPMIATQRVSFSDIENKVTDYKWLIK